MPDLKIAHVVTALSLGGAEKVAEDLSVALVEAGAVAHIVALFPPEPALAAFSAAMKDRLRAAGVAIFELDAPDRRLGLLRRLPALRRYLQRERFDIVHAHVDHAEFAVSLVARFGLGGALPARTIHNTALWADHPLLARISERGWRDDLVIAVSQDALAAHETLRRSLGLSLSAERQVIPNGVPVGAPGAGGGSGPLKAAYFGRSTPQKGLDLLFAAVSDLPTDPGGFTLDVFSDAAGSAEFRAQALACPDVKLHPPVADARARLGSYDLIVMPSRFEGLPLIALEAFAAGTPVLATRAPGLIEALPADWPLAVPVGDVAALRRQIAAAIRDPDGVRALRGRVHDHGRGFAIDRAAQRYLDAYGTFLARRRA